MIILRGYYINGIRNGGHYTVIYGYHWSTSAGCYLYDICDPGPVNVGNSYSGSYTWISRGIAGYNLENDTPYIWDGTVVLENSVYLNMIDWPGV